MNKDTKSLNPERRERMLFAGGTLFLRYGFRGTSMEAIAREAGVAKPTLYAYFPDKEAMLVAINDSLLQKLRVVIETALAAPGSAANRVAQALADKISAMLSYVGDSPHISELFGENARLAAGQIAEFEGWIEDRITTELEKDGHADARQQARLLIACAKGIAETSQLSAQVEPSIRLITQKLLG